MNKSIRKNILEMIQASIKNVNMKYFKLETTYELSGIVRERVFCYELYHQIRKYQVINNDNINKVSLNGEIDKRGHLKFKERDRKNPDFVFHIPGETKGNTSVIEVKGKLVKKEIIKDFNTLTLFVKKYNYKFGIFILYNHSIEELKDLFKQNKCKISYKDTFDKIDIITAVDNKEIMKTTLSDILN
jgi:hypothetical protein